MSSTPIASADELLAHRQFLQQIVRALLRGGDGEDDVVQEALVRAWLAGATAPRRPGSWLARIARNVGIDHLRGARRAERLRQRSPVREPAPSADEVLEAEERRAHVVHAVLALPQPYRAAVLLRYWEDLSPAAIAQRLGVAGATVRSQLLRGLAMLRERLDADHGGRRAWIVALAPFAAPADAHALAWGTLLMSKTKVVASVTVVLAAAIAVWWTQIGPARGAPGEPSRPPVAALPAAVAPSPPAAASQPGTPAAPGERVAAAPAGELAVRGQVLQRGQPFADARLELRWFDGTDAEGAPAAMFPLACDRDGRFEWRGARRDAPGTVLVVATPGQRLRLWCTGELVLPEQTEATLEVSVLALDRVLFGRVHDRAGAPIANAHLDVNGFEETAARTGADGRYELHAPAGGYPLMVRAPGYRQRLIPRVLPADAQRHEVDVQLLPGASLRGRVVDGDGKPVALAKVRASGAYDTRETDGDGRFVVDGVEHGARTEVVVMRRGFQRARASGTGGGEPVEIVMQPGLAVALRAVDDAGTPIAGATVNLLATPMEWKRRGVTGADGCFTLADLPPQPAEVVVQRAGHVDARRAIDPREPTGEVVVTLVRGHTIRGRVVDAAGGPVVGVSVYRLLGRRVTGPVDMLDPPKQIGTRADTDPEGRFELTGMPPQQCTLVAHHPDHARAELPFVGGALQETTVTLQRAASIAGTVLDGATGAPVRAFTVTARGGALPWALEPMPFAADDGRFCVRNWQMKPGPMSIVVHADGYAPATLSTEARADVGADAAAGANVVRLFAGTRVHGIVRDPATGVPVAGVTVAVAVPDPMLRPNEGPATAADGRFVLDDVPPGEQRLRLQHEDRPETVFGPFVVAAGPGQLEVHPTMGVGVALRGRVTGVAEGRGLEVMAHRADGRVTTAPVRDDLTFELRGLGTGKTTLRVSGRGGRVRSVTTVVGDHDVDGFVLPLRSGDGVIRVTVDGAAKGVAEVRRIDVASGEEATFDLLSWRGELVVDGLAPGRYRVVVRADERRRRGEAEVDVRAGEVALRVECRVRD